LRPGPSTTAPGARRESIPEKSRTEHLPAQAKGKHMGRPKGVDCAKFEKVKKALKLSVSETAALTGSSLLSVERYRTALEP